MSRLFTSLFVFALVLVFCCPLLAAEAAAAPSMSEDSGLTWYQVAGVLALLGGGGALGWTGCKKMQAIRIEPQPLEVKKIADLATRRELEDFKAEVREDFNRVHNRIDNNDRATAEIKGKLDMVVQNQQKLIDLITNNILVKQ